MRESKSKVSEQSFVGNSSGVRSVVVQLELDSNPDCPVDWLGSLFIMTISLACENMYRYILAQFLARAGQ